MAAEVYENHLLGRGWEKGMKHKKRKYLVAAYVLFLAAALAVIVYLSL